jgi:hypothetical protein
MSETYEKIDADNLKVTVTSDHIITREKLLTMLSNLEREKNKIQVDIDKINARLAILE